MTTVACKQHSHILPSAETEPIPRWWTEVQKVKRVLMLFRMGTGQTFFLVALSGICGFCMVIEIIT